MTKKRSATMRTWVTVSSPRADCVSYRTLRLTVVEGPDRGRHADFAEAKLRVGARPENQLVLSDPRVSGLHCELSAEPGGVRLRDPGSTNGTWANELRVRDAYLEQGARLRVGDTLLELEDTGGAVELELEPGSAFGPLVGASPVMRELFARLQRIAPHDVPALITGETGTGKEAVAQALHQASPRASEPFVVVECAAIPAGLIESELFGHERGAFTGAERTFPGALERAGRGTVLLDELGEMPLSLQPKLLRALESHEFRRLGAEAPRPLRARVLAATHRDIPNMVSQGTFRADLYYRLAVAEIQVPPLRQRREDILPLVEHFAQRLPNAAPVPRAVLDQLARHSWPGNVRELRNAVQRVALLGEPPLPRHSADGGPGALSDPSLESRLQLPYKQARDELLEEFRRMYAQRALERAGGSIAAAARLAQVDRMTFYRMLGRDQEESES
jgi:DNA-binding NtrC family response regulator